MKQNVQRSSPENPSSLSENNSASKEESKSPKSIEKQKHKRRSKGDEYGRDYTCGCGKRYLSYPALYTHIKTKHSGITPSGTTVPQCSTGRSRGRPHKVILNVRV